MSSIVTGDRYLEYLVRFVDRNAGPLLDGTLTLKLNPVGLHYVHSRLEALHELEGLLAGAPVDYLRAYVSDLGDHRALEQLRRILGLLTSLKVISVLPPPTRDPTPVSLLPFGRLKVLELRGCDLSTSTARGLLELRHSLEKLICHNSTDALRHVFASRIVDIRDSPVWTRLSFVSCACNGLVLMDESLQLLPAVETLDLSRNQFAKVANLRKCTKLQILDLGFNHLRSVASLSEVSCRLVKLVLRNNALTTLRGIENLKSVEGIDLSFNIISELTELEVLASLPCLQSLWLEGNPLCCARWYRAHVFSFFSHPEKLILDENSISTREYWERHIILASRQKLPSGYGFYFPAKDEPEDEGNLYTKRKKYHRLASIEDEEQGELCSEPGDEEPVSCDSDNQRKDEKASSDGESEIVNLMNKIEHMKKERSVLWLREFKEWMDQTPDNVVEGSQYKRFNLEPGGGNYINQSKSEIVFGESSMYVPDAGQAFKDDDSSHALESDMSFMDASTSSYGNECIDTKGKFTMEHSVVNGSDSAGIASGTGRSTVGKDTVKVHSWKPQNLSPLEVEALPPPSPWEDEGGDHVERSSLVSLTAIDDIMSSRPSSTYPGSPPHYQEDILQRRLYLEEEFLQLSAESRSLASSDSDTSSSEDDIGKSSTSVAEVDQFTLERSIEVSTNGSTETSQNNNNNSNHHHHHELRHEGQCSSPNQDNDYLKDEYSDNKSRCSVVDNLSQYHFGIEKRKGRRKQKRRIISLLVSSMLCDTGPEFHNPNGTLDDSEDELREKERQLSCCEDCNHESCEGTSTALLQSNGLMAQSKTMASNSDQDQFIKDLFHLKLVDSRASETCEQIVRCGCIYQLDSVPHKSEVALLRSSMDKLYILLIDVMADGQETMLKVLGRHRLEEVREVVVGLGLQALRVHMYGDITYLFLPRTSKNSEDLICLLGAQDSRTGCSLQSWEQVQFGLLEKYICGSIKMGIVFYSMLLFWHENPPEGESWVARSLFVVEGCLLLCIENLVYFGCLTENSAPPYYSLYSCCLVQDILEMVIELKNDRCLTLIMNNVSSDYACSLAKIDMGARTRESNAQKGQSGERNDHVLRWKLKWFSDETLLKLVAVLRAIHLGLTASVLPVKCIY